MLHFEDFEPGTSNVYGRCTLSEEALLAFAHAYDPQPMHLDGQSEQARMMGGLLASGWQTCALNMRMMVDGFLRDSSGVGSPGINSLKWLFPVRPGDQLTSTYHVLEKRISRSKPERGFVTFRFEMTNQHGQMVLEQTNTIMFLLKNPAQSDTSTIGKLAREEISATYPTVEPAQNPVLGRVQDLVPGTVIRIGAHQLKAQEMIDFARDYDPQPFHLSEEAGRATHFGGLVASGWQTAALWMRLTIAYWHKEQRRRSDAPKLGPSPGFRDLVWLRPVRPGDTLMYYAQIDSARPSVSRPGWGLVTQRNYALNQHGEPVFSFIGTVMWEAHLED